MKIGIAINSFKQEKDFNKREKLCIESLRKCKNKNSNVTLYNVINDKDNIYIEDFETLKFKHEKQFPFANKIIDRVSQTDSDLIVFINNDIILNSTFFKQLDDSIDVYPASRAHLHSLDSLDEDLKIESYSVHGFDLFAFKTSWWKEKGHLYPDMYLGKPYWDTVYFMVSVLNGNYKILNKQPPVIFHVDHESESCKQDDEFTKFNENIAQTFPGMNRWWQFVQTVLLERSPVNGILWWKPFGNELLLERQILNED